MPNLKRIHCSPLLLAAVVGCGLVLDALPMSIAATAETASVPADIPQAVRLPAGFKLNVFAKFADLQGSGAGGERELRFMALGADGNLYVSIPSANKIVMLADSNKDGVADEVQVVADRLNAPQGLAFVDGALLVANQDSVVRLQKVRLQKTVQQKAERWVADPVPFIRDLPAGGHTLKTIKQGPDGYLYVNIGSSCNVCVESDAARATILRYSRDGKPAGALVTLGRHAPTAVWATGLRNSQGFAWHPKSLAMFATNNGQDMRADTKGGAVNDEVPPEALNRIEPGKNYGWPYCWAQPSKDQSSEDRPGADQPVSRPNSNFSGINFPDPNFPGPPGYCEAAQAPELLLPAHSTPLGITFLQNSAFPAEYKNDAIIALHGSWNREQPSGYKLVRIRFEGDRAIQLSDFATGWLSGKRAWGRPVDVIVGHDGALYVSDDRAGMIYRIQYQQ